MSREWCRAMLEFRSVSPKPIPSRYSYMVIVKVGVDVSGTEVLVYDGAGTTVGVPPVR